MIVYRTISFTQIILTLLFRIGSIAGAAIALYHFNENPIVTSIAAAVCLLFFAISGTDEVIVYADTVKYRSNSLLKRFTKQQIFTIAKIVSIKVDGTHDSTDDLNRWSYGHTTFNTLEIKLTNGDTNTIRTSIYINDLKKAVAEIEKLLPKNAHHR